MVQEKEIELCLATPCIDNSMDCEDALWLNLEYYGNKTDKFKIGLGKMMWSEKFMLAGFVNYAYSRDKQPYRTNGISFDGQFGFLPYRRTYTTFIGLDYRFNTLDLNARVLSTSIGFSPPIPYINALQLKLGYHYGIVDATYSAPFIGVNFRTALPFTF
jgi:hypothetical protein